MNDHLKERLAEMSGEGNGGGKRPWVFGEDEEEDNSNGSQEYYDAEDEAGLDEAVLQSVLQMSIDEEKRRLKRTAEVAGGGEAQEQELLKDDDARDLDQWMKDSFQKRANEALTATRDDRGAHARTAAAVASNTTAAEDDEDEEDRQLKLAMEESMKEHRAEMKLRRQNNAIAAAAADSARGSAGGDGDDLARALRLSQDPSQQVSEDVQQMLRAVIESKKETKQASRGTLQPQPPHARPTQTPGAAAAPPPLPQEESEAERRVIAEVMERSKKEATIRNLMGDLEMENQLRMLQQQARGPRPVVIDGNNVGWEHGNQQMFSPRGILLCIHWFTSRGHEPKDIVAFSFATHRNGITPQDQVIFDELQRSGLIKIISRKNYDDLFIIKTAAEKSGVIVSNDRFRDVMEKYPEMTPTITTSVLQFKFVGDSFIPAEDPLGRDGPKLRDFLRF